MFKKHIQIYTVLLAAGMIVYTGLAAAQPLCCGTLSGTCMPAVEAMKAGHAIGVLKGPAPACRRGGDRHVVPAGEALSTGAGAENACCRNEHRDRFLQAINFSVSSPQDLYPIPQKSGATPAGEHGRTAFATGSLAKFPKVVAIYLLTQSIIR